MVWYQHFGRKRIFSGEMEHSGVSGGFDWARFFYSQSAQMTSRPFPPGSNFYITWSTIYNNQSYHQDPLMSKWTGPHPDSYLIMHHSVNEILPPHLHFINTWNLSIPHAQILTKNKFFVKTNFLPEMCKFSTKCFTYIPKLSTNEVDKSRTWHTTHCSDSNAEFQL